LPPIGLKEFLSGVMPKSTELKLQRLEGLSLPSDNPDNM